MSKSPKTFIGFRKSDAVKSRNIADVQTLVVSLQELREVCPAQTLLSAAKYTDHSLENARAKALRIQALRQPKWLESVYAGVEIDFDFQGDLTGRYYSCHVRCDMTVKNVAFLARLAKLANLNSYQKIETPEALIEALLKLKAISVQYERDQHFFYRALPTREEAIAEAHDQVHSAVS